MERETIQVGLGERSYPIHIGRNILAGIGPSLKEGGFAKRCAIIGDARVTALYGEEVRQSLADAAIDSEVISFPPGEVSKTLQVIGELASRLAGLGFDRGDGLIALGGGVSGDITGFLAAIYMRGIPFVQVPTSLLAQVDSSVGGKTGVDIAQGKNLLGAFYQPKAVFIDIATLASLPKEEFLNGMGEVIKYGAILDADFFHWLTTEREAILALEPRALIPLIRRCCQLKAEVVEKDEREGDWRRVLNFGHTIGHALELVSGYQLAHGMAVAIGMHAAARLAERGGFAPSGVAGAIAALLKDYGLPTEIPAGFDRAALRTALHADKKRIGAHLFFVLPRALGVPYITDQAAESDIDAVLAGA